MSGLSLKLAVQTWLRTRGGVHPPECKDTAAMPIRTIPAPARLYLPLKQHIGAEAKPDVVPLQLVKKGQVLARGQGSVSAHVHAPCSGHIADIVEYPAPHPSGLPMPVLVIENDGRDDADEMPVAKHPHLLAPEDIAARVQAAGIVGLGGATFPAAVKMNLGQAKAVDMLIINGCECEPYLTCDDRLMQERAAGIADGARIMAQALNIVGAPDVIIAIENNKPEAIAAMREATAGWRHVDVVPVPTQYPMGAEKQLVRYLTGREVPAGKLLADVGVLVQNVGTAYAVQQALRTGMPLVSRIVTVAGGAVARPGNYEVPIGMRVSDVLAHCGLVCEPARVVMGGPMMGHALGHPDAPVVKGTSGILALTAGEVRAEAERPCIRCAACVDACPMGLLPVTMASLLKSDKLDEALGIGLSDCISCAACSYACPSNIPLVHYFNYGKGEVVAKREAKRKDEEIKRLIEEHRVRMAAIEREKAEAAAKRQAAMEKQKAEKAAA